MEWGAPSFVWLLLMLLPAAYLKMVADKKRRDALQQLGEESAVGGWREKFCQGCLVMVFILMVVALCRPQWGSVLSAGSMNGADIVVALDCSRSMLADDLNPSRLAVARKGITELADRLHGDRIGLVAFAGNAFAICPLTTDYAAFKELVSEIDSGTVPAGGSDIGTVASEVLRSFSGTEPGGRVLIIVGDGEDFGSGAAEAARQLRLNGVLIRAVVTGTESGAVIPLPGGSFLKDHNGRVVRSRANPETLRLFERDVSRLDPEGHLLAELYEQSRPLLHASAVMQRQQKKQERFQYPLAAALLFIMLSGVCARRVP